MEQLFIFSRSLDEVTQLFEHVLQHFLFSSQQIRSTWRGSNAQMN